MICSSHHFALLITFILCTGQSESCSEDVGFDLKGKRRRFDHLVDAKELRSKVPESPAPPPQWQWLKI
jgi:hypothetical protein